MVRVTRLFINGLQTLHVLASAPGDLLWLLRLALYVLTVNENLPVQIVTCLVFDGEIYLERAPVVYF